MNIIEYDNRYDKDVKNLLEELQEYIIAMDPYHYNVLDKNYKEEVFMKDMEMLKNNNGKIYLAQDNDKIIGLIMGIIRKPIEEFDYKRLDKMGEVIELIVTKKTRSKGIGKRLLNEIEEYFKSQNCSTINIDVFGYNDIGRSFYFKNGYHTRMMTVSKRI